MAGQALIDSLTSDPERLLGQWFNRSLIPGNISLCNSIEILLATLLYKPVQLSIELTVCTGALRGSIHIFDDSNFAININILTEDEMKCIAILIGRPKLHFSNTHSSDCSNAKSFSVCKEEITLTKTKRLKLVEQACLHVLYFCINLCKPNSLQLKDNILKILLDTAQKNRDGDVLKLYKNFGAVSLPEIKQHICNSPTQITARIHDYVHRGSPSLRKSVDKSNEPRNIFPGDDWYLSYCEIQH